MIITILAIFIYPARNQSLPSEMKLMEEDQAEKPIEAVEEETKSAASSYGAVTSSPVVVVVKE